MTMVLSLQAALGTPPLCSYSILHKPPSVPKKIYMCFTIYSCVTIYPQCGGLKQAILFVHNSESRT
jgi:hypothetical protein